MADEQKPFVLGRALHLTADDQVVEETDPAGVKVLAGAGATISPEDVEKYGLDDSYRAVEEEEVAETPANDENPEAVEEAPKPLRGKLPEDFPGFKALEEAGITTYAQVRKAGDLTEIKGIGDATAASIAAALEATPEAEE